MLNGNQDEQNNIISKLTNENTKIFFQHENTILFHGDVLKNDFFNKEFIDLIITSPPYNVGIDYNSNNDTLSYQEYLEFSKNGWLIAIHGVKHKRDFV